MANTNVKYLWGHSFRVVPEGLAQSDVINFVEGLVGRYEADLDRVAHVDNLHDLAARTVQQAEQYARKLRNDAESRSEGLTQRIVGEARDKALQISEQVAREIIQAAQSRASEIEEGFRRNANERLAYIEAAISDMQQRHPSDDRPQQPH